MRPIVIRISDLVQLKDILRFGNEVWKDATIQQIGFRGQGRASWGLIPKAFRPKVTLGYHSLPIKAPCTDIVNQTRAEYRAVRSFVELSDSVGLHLPGDIVRFRNHINRTGQEAEYFWRKTWPEEEDLQLLAIAQHHGVPTRLLDFTHNPLIAAFFASIECLKLIESKQNVSEFAIWAVDLRFLRRIQDLSKNLYHQIDSQQERLKDVLVPRFGNDYLRAQAGFFLVDRQINTNWETRWCTQLEKALIDRSDHWRAQRGLWGNSTVADFFLPYVKLRIPATMATDTLTYLHGEGINLGTVFPSYDRIHEALEFMRSHGLRVE